MKKIEHIVVVMFENRSFDNLLGWLYDPENDPPYNVVPGNFNGLAGKKLSNPMPGSGRIVPAGKTFNPRGPQPNPGEPYEHVYSQMYNVDLVDAKDVPPVSPPPNMQGFIRNYMVQKEVAKDRKIDPTKIMDSLTPKTVPVLSALAHNYAVFDHWFASIPTQTFCNRSFVHAGTSSGYVNNGGGGPFFLNDTTTIFDVLEEAGKKWNIFCGSWLLESFALLTQKKLLKYVPKQRFKHFKDFLKAAGEGNLPNYSFIEPIYFDSMVWGAQTDMHPECNLYEFYGPANVHKGEEFLWTIYDAVRNGPDWESTLLIVLFDEHGGCYDHVPPPSAGDGCKVAINPSGDKNVIPSTQPGGTGFNFDRLGPRVPAIVVSAYTPPQTRINSVCEHTSVLSTVVNCFDLPKNQLGLRQAAADDVGAALTLSRPRNDKPVIPKPETSRLEDLKEEIHSILHSQLFLGAKQKPVSELQKMALHGIAQLMEDGALHERIDKLPNEFEADLLLIEQEAKLVKDKLLEKFK